MRALLPGIVDHESVDLVIANVENASRGLGVTQDAVRELRDAGVQVMTSGNHIWRKPGVAPLLESDPFLLRPANYPSPAAGRGGVVFESALGVRVGIMNLLGRIFMEPVDCPFQAAERQVKRFLDDGVRIVIIDFHAEATSEKVAFGWFLDGKASAVLGTHTHVQTADERVLPNGTGYITDVGMTGPHDSVIGVRVEPSVTRFRTGIHQRLEPAKKNPLLNGILVDVCNESGRCRAIKRIRKGLDKR